ncbi:MAG: peptidylprolyl isomerase [Gammaproteobacteria bacterium]|nr:peptidylprolyl isomerase [Gammaproteobacteria bacterium]
MLKITNSLFAGTLMLFVSCFLVAGNAQAMMLDRVLVVVNDDIITYGEYDLALKNMRAKANASGESTPPDAILKEKVLEQLVFEKLLQLHAAETGLRVTDDMINAAMVNLAKQNNLTVPQVLAQLKQDGMSEAVFRKNLSEQMLIQRVIDRDIKGSISVLDSEVDGIIRNISQNQPGRVYDISNIQLPVNEDPSPTQLEQATQSANKLRQDILSGQIGFATAARRYSQAGNAEDGGALGWKSDEQLPVLFADALKNMKEGDISEPLVSPGGIHLLKLNEIKGTKQQLVEQVKARHILLKATSKIDLEHATAEMQKIREKIIAGESFAVLATELSQDTGSAIKGGELGWMGRGDTVAPFEKSMYALKPNEISQPVVSQFGVHLIQLLDRRDVDVSEQKRRDSIRQQIGKRKAAEKYDQFLKQLKHKAYINYRIPVNEL